MVMFTTRIILQSDRESTAAHVSRWWELLCYNLTCVLTNEDHKERSDQVIYPLNVSTGRMTDGPYKQDPFKNLKENGTDGEAKDLRAEALKSIHSLLKIHTTDVASMFLI